MRLITITTIFLLCTLKQAMSSDEWNFFTKILAKNVDTFAHITLVSNTVPNMVSDEKKYLIFTKGKLVGEWGGAGYSFKQLYIYKKNFFICTASLVGSMQNVPWISCFAEQKK